MMFKVILTLISFFWMVPAGFPAEFHFTKGTFPLWQVKNYQQNLKFELNKDFGPGKEFLRITVADTIAPELTKGEKVDTAFSLISPVIKVFPEKSHSIRVMKRSSFDISDSKNNRGWNHIVWYNMYGEEVGKTFLNGMGKKSESSSYFVDTGLLALPDAEKARIVLGTDWPDFYPQITQITQNKR